MPRDSSYSYVHFHESRHGDIVEEFNRPPHLLHESIYVPPQHQPPNPEDEDDVVPDQHAAFGITRAIQARQQAAWRDLGLDRIMAAEPKEKRVGPVRMGMGMGMGTGTGSRLPR